MAHSCPVCGDACYCDVDDTWFDEFFDCFHCDGKDGIWLDDDGDDFGDAAQDD